jgi:uncharacterized protein (DUF488 family)
LKNVLLKADATDVTVYTIGHSNRSIEDFLALLQKNGITQLVDVRLFPGSRTNPQFGRDELQRSLHGAGISYIHEPRLGGRRRAAKDSKNSGWRNTSFRGYADHMATREFKAALDSLIALAGDKTTAIMCAEAVPWRCHRFLISDALTHAGWRVLHVTGTAAPSTHKFTPFLRVRGDELTYPPDQPQLELEP